MKIFSAETACLLNSWIFIGWRFFRFKISRNDSNYTKSEKAVRQSGLLLHNNFIAHAHRNKNFSSRELYV